MLQFEKEHVWNREKAELNSGGIILNVKAERSERKECEVTASLLFH